MTGKELWGSILQKAMEGKLVPQRKEEGTAAELLKEIRKERAKMVKEGKLKKTKSLPSVSEEEKPFDIPDSWEWVRLGDICSKIVDGDHNPPPGVSTPTEFMMLSAQNINNDTLNLTKVRYLDELTFDKENLRTNVQVGDIFFTIVGTLGRSCVYRGGLNICFQRSVSVLTPLIYSCYLKYALDSCFIQRYMELNANGSAQKGFYLQKVNNLLIPLPPLAEQHRIVEKLESLLALCDKLQPED